MKKNIYNLKLKLTLVLVALSIGLSYGQCGLNILGYILAPVGGTNFANYTYGPGYWFQFPMLNGGSYAITTCGAPYDTQISGWHPSTATSIFYNDDNGPLCAGTAASFDNYVPNFTGYARVQISRYNCLLNANGGGSIVVGIRQNNNLAFTSATTALCSGQTRNLSATPLNVVTTPGGYGNPGSFTGTGVSGIVFTAPVVAVPTTYTLTYTFGYVSTTQTLLVNPNPIVTVASSNSVVCAGTAVSLTANVNGPASYTWGIGGNLPGIVDSPTTSILYTVSVTSSLSCIASGSALVLTNLNPTITAVSANTAICQNASINLNATSVGNTINWYNVPSGGSILGSTGSGGNISFSPASTTTYYGSAITPAVIGSQTFVVTLATVNFTVPAGVSSLIIDARGAQGGNAGGLGARMVGTFTVVPGATLKVLVGQQGAMAANTQVGGGGGSFVTTIANVPLCVAGGGGGKSGSPGSTPGMDANITTNGNDGYSALNGAGNPSNMYFGIGGIAGSGATNGAPALGQPHAGNGGGFNTNGATGLCGGPGLSFLNGGTGGGGCSGGPGGFGGGGSGGNFGGGGGGGYSGGGGSYHSTTNGGGGGSFNAGISQTNTAGFQSGNGQVIISWNVPGGCPSLPRSPVVVTVNNLPTMGAITTATAICIGGSVTLNGSGANTYTWTGGVSNGVAFAPLSTNSYTVSGTSAAGCASTLSAVQTVVVNSLPLVTASAAPPVVCFGGSTILNGGGASTYAWSGGVTNGTSFVPPASATYTVIGTIAATGCTNSATQPVLVNPLPVLTASATSAAICFGQSTTLNGLGANTYTLLGAISATTGVAFTPTATTAFTITGTSAAGCTGTNLAVFTISVNPLPVITTTASVPIVCLGNSSTITAGGASTYSWMPGTLFGGTVIVTPTSNASYTVSGTNTLTGCASTNLAVQTVSVEQYPVVTASASNSVICIGATVTVNGAGANTYTWTGGVTNGTPFTPSATASYTVTGSSPAGCTSSVAAVQSITVNPLPAITVISSASAICVGESATLTLGGGATYSLNGVASSAAASISPTITTMYTILGNDANGCANTATVNQVVSECVGIAQFSIEENKILIYPNPNNGEFTIKTTVDMDITILNELGQIVERTTSTGLNDHNVNIRNLANGIYFVVGKENGYTIKHKIIVTP